MTDLEQDRVKRSRVVVSTPTDRREVVEEVDRVPVQSGISGGMVAALVIGAVALVTIFFLFLMNRQDTSALQAAATKPNPTPQMTIVQQPTPQQAPQPPVIIQAPVQGPVQAPPSSASAESGASQQPPVPDDLTIQTMIDEKISKDRDLTGVSANVLDGQVTLEGMVDTPEMKHRAEALVRQVKGVKKITNQINVTNGNGLNPH